MGDTKKSYTPEEKNEAGETPKESSVMIEKADPPGNRSNDKRKYKAIFLQFLALNVLLLILIVLTVSFMMRDLNTKVDPTVRLCVPCADIRLHPDDDLERVNNVDNLTCCVDSDEELYHMVHMFAGKVIKKKLSESSPSYSAYDCGSSRRSSTIKVVGRSQVQDHNHNRKVLWDSDPDLAVIPDSKLLSHHQEHGLIEIKKRGVYFVYSQLVMEHEGPGRVEDFREGYSAYQHAVHLMKPEANPDFSMSILKNRDTRCTCTKDKYRFTSNIGGAFFLEEGDRLYVQVHDVKEVVPNPHMNHFGVHRL